MSAENSYGGAIFAGSQDFIVAGGTFTSISNNCLPASPTDFRDIPLGDIDLRHEIHLDARSGVVNRQRKPRSTRRVYAAKIEGRKSSMTVAMYQGDGAEKAAQGYLKSVLPPGCFYNSLCGLFIRGATGRFCVDPIPPVNVSLRHTQSTETSSNQSGRQFGVVEVGPSMDVLANYTPANSMSCQYGLKSLTALDLEAIVVESLTLEQYHEICTEDLSHTLWGVRTPVSATSGDVVFCPSAGQLEDRVQIAALPDAKDSFYPWDIKGAKRGEVMRDGYTRFTCDSELVGTVIKTFGKGHHTPTEHWLGQANHIFNRLGISSQFEDYVVAVEYVAYEIHLSETSADPPKGFLFLPPPEDFQHGKISVDCPGYWSFNSAGVERLDSADAVKLGFPSQTLSMNFKGSCWVPGVYAGLRKFHQLKGFDPESEDVARHLGELSSLPAGVRASRSLLLAPTSYPRRRRRPGLAEMFILPVHAHPSLPFPAAFPNGLALSWLHLPLTLTAALLVFLLVRAALSSFSRRLRLSAPKGGIAVPVEKPASNADLEKSSKPSSSSWFSLNLGLGFISWETLPTTIAESLPATLHPPPPPVMRGRHVYRGGRGIRDFPKVSTSLGGGDLEELVLAGLKNCVNLCTCTWTRDGALNSAVLRVLQASDTLAELEINGHSDGPTRASSRASADVVGRMSTWVARTGPQLRSLTLICKTSPLIVVEALAPNVVHLDQFSLTGCLRVTHRGISAILSHNAAGLRALALEGLAPEFVHIALLAAHCASTPTVLARLHSFTLSVYTPAWLTHGLTLLAHAPPLEIIQPYAADPLFLHPTAAVETDDFWRALVDAHGPHLTRVSVHRMAISLRAAEDVCVRCPALRQLFVVVDPMAMPSQPASRAHVLAAVHINFPTTTTVVSSTSPSDRDSDVYTRLDVEVPVVLKAPDALFGCNARVWQVERKVWRTDTGELVVQRSLGKYESPDVPEQFLVVRT
ncbi:hypothetical protein DFH08DRAFT_958799 [Mycena albidolilacea]|uniref:Uncharacterized protein n=1 Tax=Mycena albidolilacea TaxID=1033008 RepID=A0AAD7A5I7_9AGAR|nr:hypothetical protein DFH08DRAFT_958799 [Mycena albidolilacea]